MPEITTHRLIAFVNAIVAFAFMFVLPMPCVVYAVAGLAFAGGMAFTCNEIIFKRAEAERLQAERIIKTLVAENEDLRLDNLRLKYPGLQFTAGDLAALEQQLGAGE